MTVTAAFTLPDQPAAGTVNLQPLGGDGFSSPHSVYQVRATVDADSSTGRLEQYIRFDPRFVQVVSNVIISIESPADTTNVMARITGEQGGRLEIRQAIPVVAVSGQGSECVLSWTPEPMAVSSFLDSSSTAAPHVRVVLDNVDTEDLTVDALIYNFDKRARELAPLSDIFSFLSRTGGVI